MIRLRRISKIVHIALRYRLDTFIESRSLRWLPEPRQTRGERLRLALESLGPVFIKFGQLLSTRRDLMPADIADELARLQDQVPPFDSDCAVAIIEKALGAPIDQLYKTFSHKPLASASVAQVHAATLADGEEVVVKVIRPGIENIIRQDIALLYTLARFVHRFLPDGRRLRLVEVVDDYQLTILDELDLQREGANTAQLRRNFDYSPLLYVPKVFWDYTRTTVLTIERIDGIAVTNVAALEAQNTDMKLLAERGVEIFFTQVFRDNFFHADMHPGNVFVSRKDPERPQYIAIDCAIIGSLSEDDQYYLARNLLAIFQRDYRYVAQLHIECGWVPPSTKVHEFEAAIRSACEPIFQKPLGEISFGQMLIYLFQTARRFDMEVQPALVLLQKTLLNIEGLGRELYPQLDLWATAQPYLEQWLKDRYSPRAQWQRLKHHAPAWIEQLPQLPEALFATLQQARQLPELLNHVQQRLDTLPAEQRHQRRSKRLGRLAALTAIAALLIANNESTLWLASNPLSAALLAVAAILWLAR